MGSYANFITSLSIQVYCFLSITHSNDRSSPFPCGVRIVSDTSPQFSSVTLNPATITVHTHLSPSSVHSPHRCLCHPREGDLLLTYVWPCMFRHIVRTFALLPCSLALFFLVGLVPRGPGHVRDGHLDQTPFGSGHLGRVSSVHLHLCSIFSCALFRAPRLTRHSHPIPCARAFNCCPSMLVVP